MTHKLLFALIVALALPVASASAASIAQLDGTAGCLSESGEDGCAAMRHVENILGIAMSPDGQNLYAASMSSATNDGTLAVFSRDEDTGALTQLPGEAGCITRSKTRKCAQAPGLAQVAEVAVSPDGRTVYSLGTWFDHAALDVWRRNAGTGELDLLECWADTKPFKGCNRSPFSLPDMLALSRNGRRIFLGGAVLGSFKVKKSGRLGAARCDYRARKRAKGLCADARRVPSGKGHHLGGIGLQPSADGDSLIASMGPGIARLAVKPRTGKARVKSCVDEEGAETPCGDARVVFGLRDLAVSPVGGSIYAAVDDFVIDDEEENIGHSRSSAISVFDNDLEELSGEAGCVLYRGSQENPGCSTRPEPEGPPFRRHSAIAVTPDGDFAVAGFYEPSAMVLLSRDSSGALALVTGKNGCVSEGYEDGFGKHPATKGCTLGHGMTHFDGRGVLRIVVSPDGRNAYASIDSPKIAAFALTE